MSETRVCQLLKMCRDTGWRSGHFDLCKFATRSPNDRRGWRTTGDPRSTNDTASESREGTTLRGGDVADSGRDPNGLRHAGNSYLVTDAAPPIGVSARRTAGPRRRPAPLRPTAGLPPERHDSTASVGRSSKRHSTITVTTPRPLRRSPERPRTRLDLACCATCGVPSFSGVGCGHEDHRHSHRIRQSN